jgi:hypothetical protein
VSHSGPRWRMTRLSHPHPDRSRRDAAALAIRAARIRKIGRGAAMIGLRGSRPHRGRSARLRGGKRQLGESGRGERVPLVSRGVMTVDRRIRRWSALIGTLPLPTPMWGWNTLARRWSPVSDARAVLGPRLQPIHPVPTRMMAMRGTAALAVSFTRSIEHPSRVHVR